MARIVNQPEVYQIKIEHRDQLRRVRRDINVITSGHQVVYRLSSAVQQRRMRVLLGFVFKCVIVSFDARNFASRYRPRLEAKFLLMPANSLVN